MFNSSTNVALAGNGQILAHLETVRNCANIMLSDSKGYEFETLKFKI